MEGPLAAPTYRLPACLPHSTGVHRTGSYAFTQEVRVMTSAKLGWGYWSDKTQRSNSGATGS